MILVEWCSVSLSRLPGSLINTPVVLVVVVVVVVDMHMILRFRSTSRGPAKAQRVSPGVAVTPWSSCDVDVYARASENLLPQTYMLVCSLRASQHERAGSMLSALALVKPSGRDI